MPEGAFSPSGFLCLIDKDTESHFFDWFFSSRGEQYFKEASIHQNWFKISSLTRFILVIIRIKLIFGNFKGIQGHFINLRATLSLPERFFHTLYRTVIQWNPHPIIISIQQYSNPLLINHFNKEK